MQHPPYSVPLVDSSGKVTRPWVATIDAFSTGTLGTSSVAVGTHNDLEGRSENDAHPVSAITGLSSTISSLEAAIDSVESVNAIQDASILAIQASLGAQSSINANVEAALATKIESVYTDGVTITGSGTESDPLVAVPGGGIIEQLEFDTTPSTFLAAEGQLQWNPTDHTLDIRLSDGVTLQTGQEIIVPCVNKTGSDIPDGSVVMLIGAQGQRTEIALADADSYYGSQATLGITTQAILNNAVGFVTTLGLVRDIDTHLWADGTAVYLSQTAGQLTSTIPPKGVRAVFVGLVVKGGSVGAGSVFVTIKDTQFLGEACDVAIPSPIEGDVPYRNSSGVYAPFNLKAVATATKDITGWESNHLITEEYNATNRTVTLTTTAPTLRYWLNNVVTDLGTNTWTSTAHANTIGRWYLYSTDGVTFAWYNTLWDFTNIMVLSLRYVSASKYVAVREVHGLMPWTDHRYGHYNSGTIRLNSITTEGIVGGYVIGDYTTAANRRPSCSEINLLDEDLPSLVSAMVDGGPYSHVYVTGASSSDFVVATEAEIVRMSGTTPQYTTTAGVLTPMPSNSYANCWLVAVPTATDTESLKMRWVWIQPQMTHANLALAQAETWASLAKGDFSSSVAEYLPVAQVTIKRESTNFSIAATPLIITGSRNGGGVTSSGGAITTLQQAYEVSGEPEITLNATRGAFSIKAVTDGNNAIEILNSAGATTASITGGGLINSTGLDITSPANSSSGISFKPVADVSNQLKQAVRYYQPDGSTQKAIVGYREGVVSLGAEDFRVAVTDAGVTPSSSKVRIGTGVATASDWSDGQLSIGHAAAAVTGVWRGGLSPASRTASNYLLYVSSASTYLNAPTTTFLAVGDVAKLSVDAAETVSTNTTLKINPGTGVAGTLQILGGPSGNVAFGMTAASNDLQISNAATNANILLQTSSGSTPVTRLTVGPTAITAALPVVLGTTTSTTSGALYNVANRGMVNYTNGPRLMMGTVFCGATGTTLTNSTVETTISTTAAFGTATLPANILQAGTQVRVRLMVNVTNSSVANTLTVRVKIGGTTVWAFTSVTHATAPHSFDVIAYTAAAPSAASSVMAGGYNDAYFTASATLPNNLATNGALAVTATLQWASANASSVVGYIAGIDIT